MRYNFARITVTIVVMLSTITKIIELINANGIQLAGHSRIPEHSQPAVNP